MIRLTLFVALAAAVCAGCARPADLIEGAANAGAVAAQPGAKPQDAKSDASETIKTPLVRALLQTIDEIQGESPEVKDSLKRTLREADQELGKVLGGKSQQLIMKANRKPAPLVIGDPPKPAKKPEESSKQPGGAPPADSDKKDPSPAGKPAPPPQPPAAPDNPKAQAPAESGVKTPLIRALMQTLDEAEGESDEVKQQVKQMLQEADQELSKVLGGKSQELIMKANRRLPAPVIANPPGRPSGVKVIEFQPRDGAGAKPQP